MTTYEYNREEQTCNFNNELLKQDLSQHVPRAKTIQSGRYIFVLFEQSSWSIYQVADDIFDVCVTLDNDGESKKWEGINRNDLEVLLMAQQEIEFPDSVIPKTPSAADNDVPNPALEPMQLSERTAYAMVDIQDTILKSKSLEYMVQYFGSVLLCDWAKLTSNNTIEIKNGEVLAFIEIQEDGKYYYELRMGEDVLTANTVTCEKLRTYMFSAFEKIDAKRREFDRKEMESEDGEFSSSEVFGVLKEFCKELGQSTDIFRNKDLVDLSGLSSRACQARHESYLDALDRDLLSKQPIREQVQSTPTKTVVNGSKTHAGAPVSLNESRDASHPYGDTLGGKVLQYIAGIGSVFVNKSDIEQKPRLNIDPNTGEVVFNSLPLVQPSRKYSRFGRNYI